MMAIGRQRAAASVLPVRTVPTSFPGSVPVFARVGVRAVLGWGLHVFRFSAALG